ncbi:MAG: thiamine pyrophosphate-binding protein [Gammaproteobacteria bacterium]|nr:thiamine pyrophosphate-binding protein [Gammaproteobacteria bacterium]MDD9957411.1 thiamine pyrophosphate-binding protein [Gammaproteobacteria bacterium]
MNSQSNKNITGKSAFLSLLKQEGITHLFGNPGTTELPVMDALPDHPDLKYVLGLQEATVVAMADGFSRATGRLTACNVHVAPGLGNAMGSLYNAKFFGSPIIITAGQQEQGHGLTEPMLYDPLVPIAEPLVKWAVEVTRLEDLPRIVHRAAKIALTPPTGPVFISLPGDILNAEAPLELGSATRIDTTARPTDEVLNSIAQRLLRAESPIIVSGHEVATHDALEEVGNLAEALGAPIYQQSVPYGAHAYSEHSCFIGGVSRVQAQARELLEKHDLMICIGADVLRMSVFSEVDPLPASTSIVQIGLRDWEMGKNYPTELAIRADVKSTLKSLIPVIGSQQSPDQQAKVAAAVSELRTRNWTTQREKHRESLIQSADLDANPIDPELLMLQISESIPANAVIVDEALVSGTTMLRYLARRDAQSYFGLASGGIGFAVAGAVGIQLALPDRPVVAVIGDGSSMYNIQALWTAANLELPITYVIANNRGYRILKERLIAFHDNYNFIGMDFHSPELDFVSLAESMGVKSRRIEKAADFPAAFKDSINTKGPTLLEVMVDDGFGNQ